MQKRVAISNASREPGIGRASLVIFRKRMPGLSRSTLERFVLRARRLAKLRGTVNILIAGNSELRTLNRRFRGVDKSTDVLSFPAAGGGSAPAGRFAGEITISADIARANARSLDHSLAEEVKILILHGILHLAGFDHEHDGGEMARKENQLRRQLKLEDGLIERSRTASASSGDKRLKARRARWSQP
jgi:probable rRNA maturation factor